MISFYYKTEGIYHINIINLSPPNSASAAPAHS